MPVLTEYIIRRLINVSDLDLLDLTRHVEDYSLLPFESGPHLVKEIGERCGSENVCHYS